MQTYLMGFILGVLLSIYGTYRKISLFDMILIGTVGYFFGVYVGVSL